MFDIDNEGQCHGVQHSPWCYSMANNNLYKVTLEHFSLALTVSKYSHSKILDIENVDQGHDPQHALYRYTIANSRLPS